MEEKPFRICTTLAKRNCNDCTTEFGRLPCRQQIPDYIPKEQIREFIRLRREGG